MDLSVIDGGASNAASQGIVSDAGWSNSRQSQANTGCSSSLTGGTSYSGYGGIYPQATPLRQVALALRRSASPMTAKVAPSTAAGCSASHASAGSSSEKDKHSSQKRKFQELPATVKGPPNFNQKFLQGSELAKPHDLTSEVSARDVSNIPASKKLIEPSTSGMLPPRTRSPPSMPPPQKFSSPLPPPNLTSVPSAPDSRSMATEPRAESVPDTLIKLMEYGDDDDEPEETSLEPFERKSGSTDTPKPFWAI